MFLSEPDVSKQPCQVTFRCLSVALSFPKHYPVGYMCIFPCLFFMVLKTVFHGNDVLQDAKYGSRCWESASVLWPSLPSCPYLIKQPVCPFLLLQLPFALVAICPPGYHPYCSNCVHIQAISTIIPPCNNENMGLAVMTS